MDKNQEELKKFLQEQVEWCKQQDRTLEKIENKLFEMKKLSEYSRDYKLSPSEIKNLNDQLNKMRLEIYTLEQQLQSEVN
ncbi:hypothetical protein MKZ01_03130 [Lysinibacillus endophyticus]|uniref:hypothetical protein n=1 Tax=Ureibacillus endophyticus TaxID=1978490 RepID=UPI0031367BFD